jgi:exodeoxyribonuclease-3
MKIATYNVNSIRQRLPIVIEWLCENEPDVLALQEIKCDNDKFPTSDFEDIGYQVVVNGQKGTHGVAIASRTQLRNVRTGMGDPLFPEDARIISGELDGVTILNTYVPNGTEVGSDKFDYKLRWLARIRGLIAQLMASGEVIWLGDINIAPTPNDVYNSPRFLGKVGHHPTEFKLLSEIVELGLVDCFRKFTQGAGHYSYWDFVILTSVAKNFGWRIDHIYASKKLAEKCIQCQIDRAPRSMEKPSDHTVVWAEFEI